MSDLVYERMQARYTSGEVPWDDTLPPPEVQALTAPLIPARALDLGCGYGRTSIYLAQQGWQVDGVDFVAEALNVAEARAKLATVAVKFYQGSVTDLSMLKATYQLAIDVGCAHALYADEFEAYHAELTRLLEPGARYLLFARLRQPEMMPDRPGLDEAAFCELFAQTLSLEKVEYGQTEMSSEDSWQSAWFYWRRN